VYASQNLGEFWNVSTRPLDRNGFGLSIAETGRRFEAVAQNMTLLKEVDAVFPAWLPLMKAHEVRGIQVHDAHLAAVLEVHGVNHLLTFNASDFKRFPSVHATHPQKILDEA
jgi:predicted nucleic acid-binding protein